MPDIEALVITTPDIQKSCGATLALGAFGRLVTFPKLTGTDRAYLPLATWALVQWLWDISIVGRPRGRFEVQPKSWNVERTYGWLSRGSRLSRLYERTIESDAAFVCVAMTHLMVTRLA